MQDEALAYWCFVSLMDKMEANFSDDSTNMQSQLATLKNLVELVDPELHAFFEGTDSLNYLFCYRWLLVHFKREFTFDEVRGLSLRKIPPVYYRSIHWACQSLCNTVQLLAVPLIRLKPTLPVKIPSVLG